MTDLHLRLIASARRERRSSLLLGVVVLAAGLAEIVIVVAIAATGHIRPRAMLTLSALGAVSLAFAAFLLWRGAKNRLAERSPSMQTLLAEPGRIVHIDEIRRSSTSIVRVTPAREGASTRDLRLRRP